MRDCPDEPNAVYLKAQAHLQAGESQAARLAFKRAIALNMDAADYYVGLGDACARVGNDDEAREAYASAVRFNGALEQVVAARLAELAPAVAAPAPPILADAPVAVARNAPCPCGSGLRYKQCHGRIDEAEDRGAVSDTASEGDDRALGLRLAVTGANRRARAALGARHRARPRRRRSAARARAARVGCRRHRHGAGVESSAQPSLAADDMQMAENLAMIRNARLGARARAQCACQASTLVGDAPGRSSRRTDGSRHAGAHRLAIRECARGERKCTRSRSRGCLRRSRIVTLWATQADIPPALVAKGVVPIAANRGHFPKTASSFIFGSWQAPPRMARAGRPSRIARGAQRGQHRGAARARHGIARAHDACPSSS